MDLTELDNLLARGSVRVAEGHEIGVFFYRNGKYRPYRGASLFRPRPQTTFHQDSVTALGQISWSGVFGESLLVEARASRLDLYFPYGQQPDREPEVSRWELNTGIWYGGSGTNTIYERDRWQGSATATLFRDGLFGGTNEFKVGFETTVNPGRTTHDLHGGIVYIHNPRAAHRGHALQRSGGRPELHPERRTLRPGQPRPRRMVLEFGLRADWWGAGYPDQENEPGPWSEAFRNFGIPRQTTGESSLVSWLGVAPRFGVNYQLTEDGRTQVRLSAGATFTNWV